MTNDKLKAFLQDLRTEEEEYGNKIIVKELELLLEHVNETSAKELAQSLASVYEERHQCQAKYYSDRSKRRTSIVSALVKLEREKGSATIADHLDEIKEFVTSEAIAFEIFKAYNKDGVMFTKF